MGAALNTASASNAEVPPTRYLALVQEWRRLVSSLKADKRLFNRVGVMR